MATSLRRIEGALGPEGRKKVSARLQDLPEITSYSVSEDGFVVEFAEGAPIEAVGDIERMVAAAQEEEEKERAESRRPSAAKGIKGTVKSLIELVYSPEAWKDARKDLTSSLLFEMMAGYFTGLASWPAAKKFGKSISLQNSEILTTTIVTNGAGVTLGTLAGMKMISKVDESPDGIKKYDLLARAGIISCQAIQAASALAPVSYAVLAPIAQLGYSMGVKITSVLDPRKIYHQSLNEKAYPTLLAQKSLVQGVASGAGAVTGFAVSSLLGEGADFPLIAIGTAGGILSSLGAAYSIRWEQPTDRDFDDFAGRLLAGEELPDCRTFFEKVSEKVRGKKVSFRKRDPPRPATARFCSDLEEFCLAAASCGMEESELQTEVYGAVQGGKKWVAAPSTEGTAVLLLGDEAGEANLWDTFEPICFSKAYERIAKACGGQGDRGPDGDLKILAEGLSMYMKSHYGKSGVRLAMQEAGMDFERLDSTVFSYDGREPIKKVEIHVNKPSAEGRGKESPRRTKMLGAYAALLDEAPETVYALTEACAETGCALPSEAEAERMDSAFLKMDMGKAGSAYVKEAAKSLPTFRMYLVTSDFQKIKSDAGASADPARIKEAAKRFLERYEGA